MNIANTQLVLVLPRASLWVRIPFALLGVGSMLFAVNFAAGGLFGLNFLSGTVHGYCLLGFVCSSSFGSIFLSVWLYESRFLYNRTSNEIIGMTRFICVWWRYRQPL